MKKIFYGGIAIYFLLGFLAGCSSRDNAGGKSAAVQINKYKMTVEDLNYDFSNIPYDELISLKTEDGKRVYLDRLIEKEILLQEAQRQGIDREKDFMKSIESYWEQALLKSLLQRKSKEISSSVRVYDDEIEEYYRNSKESKPLSKVSLQIKEIIREKKETEAMNVWISELKKKSYIKVNEDVLKEVF